MESAMRGETGWVDGSYHTPARLLLSSPAEYAVCQDCRRIDVSQWLQ